MLEKISRSQQVEDLDHLEDLESFLGCHVFLKVFGSDWQVGFFQKWPYEVGTRCNALDRLGSESSPTKTKDDWKCEGWLLDVTSLRSGTDSSDDYVTDIK